MPPSPNLVNATAAQRLGAKILDALPVAALLAAAPLLLSLAMPGRDALPVGFAAGGALAGGFALWLWIWEAGTGKTPGNLALGIRTTSEDGRAPGLIPVLLRNVLLALSGITVAGPVVLLLSNLWDRNSQRQGWHDKVARTLVVDVRAGRDPLLTGGLHTAAGAGRTSPAGSLASAGPLASTAVPGPGPMTSVPGFTAAAQPAQGRHQAATPQFQAAPVAAPQSQAPQYQAQQFQAPAAQAVPAPPAARSMPFQSVPVPAPVAAPVPAPPGVHPDEELEMTRVARRRRSAGIRIRFDDGNSSVITGTALLGRNPGPKPQETADQLLDFADMGRSVSKTHLHLQADPNGIWVTDRNSTNGSAVVTVQGLREELEPGRPVLAPPGSTVFFGDRSFTVAPV
ncbi:RDD family protein [Arthrobacter sp. zg-Y1143]|uniref:RDD family protein n=1 Tax=Arthrobacter sp. zg-Y1143 TaxID=3049065 RepID=UPI0024C2EA18|nr:RDD family protein [Arthrobacter sp. zg-Y1143]MDK1328416.1 RDD family protein [Arthrobacter sp. zg-Y1143]